MAPSAVVISSVRRLQGKVVRVEEARALRVKACPDNAYLINGDGNRHGTCRTGRYSLPVGVTRRRVPSNDVRKGPGPLATVDTRGVVRVRIIRPVSKGGCIYICVCYPLRNIRGYYRALSFNCVVVWFLRVNFTRQRILPFYYTLVRCRDAHLTVRCRLVIHYRRARDVKCNGRHRVEKDKVGRVFARGGLVVKRHRLDRRHNYGVVLQTVSIGTPQLSSDATRRRRECPMTFCQRVISVFKVDSRII